MDSDDDGDYKRGRDKFRSERRGGGGYGGGGGGYDGGHNSPPPAPRREWRDARPGPTGAYGRDGGGRHLGGGGNSRYDGGGNGYGGGGGGRRHSDRYSPGPPSRRMASPPHKRMRGNDWDDRGGYDGGHHRGGDHYDRGHRGGGGGGGGGGSHDDSIQPAMMSFKLFLGTQDDTITDEDAIKKYAEYKLEFKRQQLNEFFVHHKEEEWFKLKYHPEDASKRKEELKAALDRRLKVFKHFCDHEELKLFQDVHVDGESTEGLLRVLDSVTIFLEGGNENDLKILDEEAKAAAEKKSAAAAAAEGEAAKKDDAVKKEDAADGDSKDDKDGAPAVSDEQLELQKKAKEYLDAKGAGAGAAAEGEQKAPEEANKRKRKRTKEFDDDSSDSSSSDEEDGGPPGMKKEAGEEEDSAKAENGDAKPKEEPSEEKKEDGEEEIKKELETEKEEEKKKDEEKGEGERTDGEKPRELHRTSSIFLRNLAPTITKQEVEAMCKRYSGFLRASISDPQPDRRWFRRGWVTFVRGVKIKDICFQLNNIRLRDCELGAIVNRDLTRRIRTINGLTVDRKVVRNDIKLAAKIITNLDKRWGLWEKVKPKKEEEESTENKEEEGDETTAMDTEATKPAEAEAKADADDSQVPLGLNSTNPVLDNITDYLIEEASAEEEELLGKNSELEDGEEGEEGYQIFRDEELIKVLDRMIFYLRIVHSVDFYSHSEYPNEHEMPNRCGIMHARGTVPTTKVTQTEIDEYCNTFERKMGSFLQPRADLTEEEASKLGMKDEKDEVEKFVQANTQELGKDKWLCPISGKKFKGPDFVRKHIFNKHAEKVDEVKKEVQYYNNYLRDPKRPQLPENPSNKAAGGGGGGGGRREAPPPPPHHGRSDPYNYSGFPREATSYPVYDDRRGGGGGGGDQRGYNEPRYGRQDMGGYNRYPNRRPPPPDFGPRGGGRIRDRVGPGPGIRVSHFDPDPRGVIDYSDVDHSTEADFF